MVAISHSMGECAEHPTPWKGERELELHACDVGSTTVVWPTVSTGPCQTEGVSGRKIRWEALP